MSFLVLLVVSLVILLPTGPLVDHTGPLNHRTASMLDSGRKLTAGNLPSSPTLAAGAAPIGIAGQIVVGGTSTEAVYDPANGYLYDNVGASLYVLRGLAVIAVLRLTETGYLDYPELWLDPLNGNVYTAVWLSSTVSFIGVVNGTAFLGNVTVGGESTDIAFDGANGWAYVTNWETGNVSVIAGAKLVATLAVGPTPGLETYDPSNGYVYVAGGWNGPSTITVLSGASLVATISVGTDADTPTWDPGNGYVYVPNQGSGNVSVINGTALIASVDVSVGPFTSLYDGANGYLYVQCVADGGINVSVIHGTVLLATIPISSWGLSYAGFVEGPGGEVYVGDPAAGAVVVVNGTGVVARVVVVPSDTQGAPEYVELSYDSTNGYVYAAWTNVGYTTSASNVSAINGSTDLGQVEVPGPEAQPPVWDAADGLGYVVDADSDFVYALNNTTIPAYAVQFTERGLGVGTEWSISLATTTAFATGTTLTLWEPNGTYVFAVQATVGYTPSPSNGTILVRGGTPPQALVFTSSSAPFPVGYILMAAFSTAVVLSAITLGRRWKRRRQDPPFSRS